MKTITLLLASLLTISSFANNSVHFVDRYRAEKGFFKTFRIPMSFDTDSVTRVKPKNLKIGEIYRIDYIATSYSTKLTDYQKYLNRKRWETVYEFLDLEKDADFEKHAYYQTKFNGEEEAEKMFHGFIVYFRQPASMVHATSLGSTDELMETICRQKITDRTSQVYIPKSRTIDSVFVGDVEVKQKKDIERKLMKSGNVVIEWGYDSLGYDKKYYNSYYILTKVAPGIALAFSHLADRSLFDMFKRNNINEKTMIVTDMTGSMYPYYSQLLVWHAFKMSQGKKMNHVFFNDGDKKPDNKKTVGSTGGLYFNRANDILEVYKTMHSCMNGGYGGDLPENNFEAVKKGLRHYPSTNNVLMLCDNWAVPRDTALVKSIEKPITFIMCGAEMGVNSKYIDLAAQNQGTIMTVENSITDLKTVEEGDVIKVGRKQFKKGRKSFQKIF